MSEDAGENRTFDELRVGDTARLERELTAADVEAFARVSGDHNPTHLDTDYAKAFGYPERVGHSLWGGTLVSGLLGNVLPGPGTVYRRQDIRYHRPVFLGDRLAVTVTVVEKLADGVVRLACHGENARGEQIFEGMAEVVAPTRKIPIDPAHALPATLSRSSGFDELLATCAELAPVPTAIVHPCEETALAGPMRARDSGLIEPLLIGPEARLRALADTVGIDLHGVEIVDAPHSHAAAATGAQLVREGRVRLLMKGSLHTDELMGAVLSSSSGLRTGRRVSHVFVIDVPTYPRLLYVTDAAINIAPDLEAKRDICQNVIDLAHALGVEQPKVAVLSAVETVTPKIPSTLDAAALCKMAERRQIEGGILDGPLAMDNAISEKAAAAKGISSPVAGVADVLVAPDLEAGNILAKQLTFLGGAEAAGIVLGARVPIVLTSRADSVRVRLASCAVAALLDHNRLTAAARPQ